MNNKVLFVDDESAVLEGFKRTLHREFQVDVALGGAEGLATIEKNGPYAVVVSDMRMPQMNGAQFLAQVRRNAPDTVRMLLTGYTDLDATLDAVNQGNIFRFLSKPCEKEVLVGALSAGMEQFQLVTSERELLEKTLMGSIRVLSDVLGAASPEVFGRSRRISRYVHHLLGKFPISSSWRFEAAASLSQLGCITLDTELVQRAYAGAELTVDERHQFEAHPQRGMELLGNIPRLEGVAWMIGQQLKPVVPQLVPEVCGVGKEAIVFGSRMLKLAVAYEDLKMKLAADDYVLVRLRSRSDEFGRELVEGLSDFKPDPAEKALRKVPTSKLAAGMVLNQEIRNRQGMLVVAKGQEVTRALLFKLENFSRTGTIDTEVMAYVAV